MTCNFWLQKGGEYVKKINGIFCFKVKSGNKEAVWVIDAKNGNGSVKFDPAGKVVLSSSREAVGSFQK